MNDHLDQLLRDGLHARAAHAPADPVDVGALAARGAARRRDRIGRLGAGLACLGFVVAGTNAALRSAGPADGDHTASVASVAPADNTTERIQVAGMAEPAGDAAVPVAPGAADQTAGTMMAAPAVAAGAECTVTGDSHGEQVFAFDGTVVALEAGVGGSPASVFDVHEWFAGAGSDRVAVTGLAVGLGDRLLVEAAGGGPTAGCLLAVPYGVAAAADWRTLRAP